MSTRRVTRSATSVLHKLDSNASLSRFADGAQISTADTGSTPAQPKKRASKPRGKETIAALKSNDDAAKGHVENPISAQENDSPVDAQEGVTSAEKHLDVPMAGQDFAQPNEEQAAAEPAVDSAKGGPVKEQAGNQTDGKKAVANDNDAEGVPSKKRGATSKAGNVPKRARKTKATLPATKPAKTKKEKVKKTIEKRNWALPHGMGLTLAIGKAGPSSAAPDTASPTAEAVKVLPQGTNTTNEEDGLRLVAGNKIEPASVGPAMRLDADQPLSQENKDVTMTGSADTLADDIPAAPQQNSLPVADAFETPMHHVPVESAVDQPDPMEASSQRKPRAATKKAKQGVEESATPVADMIEVPGRKTRGAAKKATNDNGESASAQTGNTAASKRKTRGKTKMGAAELAVVEQYENVPDAVQKAETVGGKDKSGPDFKPKNKRGEANKYGLTRGYSPYPYRTAPTPEQCEEVHRILVDTHGEVKQPEKVPAPSIEVTGCGEVPSVLDALLRTRISANTLMAHSNKAIQQLAQTYGTAKHGVGKGSIDWNAVRLGSMDKLINAIRPAGTPKIKAGHIKQILDMVHEEQKARAHAHIEGEIVPGAQNENVGQKAQEVANVMEDYLSLEHMRAMTADEAINEFVKFPGIGVKTAACVLLFCLHVPCFAVDTHVQKMCKWLGWVPEKANEMDTFNHGEHMVPDHLKYALHQLFIAHGQDCFKCRKNTKPGSSGWNEAPDCPLEHLLDRNKALVEQKKQVRAGGEEAADDEGFEQEKKPERGKGKKGRATAKDEEDAEGDYEETKKPKRGRGKKKASATKVEEEPAHQAEVVAENEGLDQLTSKTKQKGKGTKAGKKANASVENGIDDNAEQLDELNAQDEVADTKEAKKKGNGATGKKSGITIKIVKKTKSKTHEADESVLNAGNSEGQNPEVNMQTAGDTNGANLKAHTAADTSFGTDSDTVVEADGMDLDEQKVSHVVQQKATRFNLRSRRQS